MNISYLGKHPIDIGNKDLYQSIFNIIDSIKINHFEEVNRFE
jgi:hypothetical protein